MLKFQNKTANDALTTLDKLESTELNCTVIEDITNFCKKAKVDAECSDYLVKFAREFISLSSLSTEDLVKRALQRFLRGRNTDSILRGIKQASVDDNILAKSALVILNEKEVSLPEEASLAACLEKRAQPLARAAGKGLTAGGRWLTQRALPWAAGKFGRTSFKALPSAGASAGRGLQLTPFGKALGVAGLGAGAGFMGGRASAPSGHTDKDMRLAELNAILPFVSQSRNPEQILQYVQQLSSMGQEASPEVWDALRFGLRYRANPWMRFNPWS